MDQAGTDLLLRRFAAESREYAIICVSPAGHITEWLGAAPLVFGYDREEMLGRPFSSIFTPGDVDKGLDQQELDIAALDSRSEDDRWHERKDGTRVWVTGSVQAVRDERGAVLGFVKIAVDRTDLQGRIERLEQQNEGGVQAAERTRAFLRTLGHEMRNPLAPILNATHLLRRAKPGADVGRLADMIAHQVDALRRMADDLMDIARLDINRVQLNRQHTDMRDLVHEACEGFQSTAKARGVKLASIQPSGALPLEVDRARFLQVLHNLLTNAIKYTPAGGQVWMKVTQEENDVVIRVEDTGIGISPEMLPVLFELFTREATASRLAPSGLGIGLAVVKAVVELHGGTVQARSPGQGKGAEFIVRVPVRGVNVPLE